MLSRGDRRVAEGVYEAWRRGAKFDAWGEYFNAARWADAFSAAGIDAARYAHREWDTAEPLPWDHIDPGVTKAYLRGQWKATLTGKTIADCHHGECNVCGMQDLPVAHCVAKLNRLAETRRRSRLWEGESLELV